MTQGLFPSAVDSLGDAAGSFELFFLDCVKVAMALAMAAEVSGTPELCRETARVKYQVESPDYLN